MASSSENISMAVFCDFENVALGVRDANYDKFDIKLVLERLLLKGSIVVKKAYCDWDRYKSFKGPMHEANFELIEIPHVRQSGKNSADIRLVVDALDLCYTKAHVDTFVIISGDSDFSPLVSKLRENAKRVIGVGVKQSTSDLLVANCDEFIFYDDLVREIRRAAAKRDERKAQPQAQPAPSQGRRPADEGNNRKREEMEARRLQALDMVCETFDALVSERGDTGKIWASLLKDTLKRRRPDFSESYYGFRTFGNLLEEAQTRGLFEFGRDEKSGTYVFRSAGAQADLAPVESMNVAAEPETMGMAEPESDEDTAAPAPLEQPEAAPSGREPRRRGGRGRKSRDGQDKNAVQPAEPQSMEPVAPQADAQLDEDADDVDGNVWPAPTPDLAEEEAAYDGQPPAEEAVAAPVEAPVKERRRAARAPRKPSARKGAAPAVETADAVDAVEEPAPAPAPGTTATPDAVAEEDSTVDGQVDTADTDADVAAPAGRKPSGRPPRKPSTRAPRRPAKPKASSGNE